MTRIHHPASIPGILGTPVVPGKVLSVDVQGNIVIGGGDTAGDAPVVAGDLMVWKDQWINGSCYNAGDTVKDGEWTMVANKYTCDRPAPQSLGLPEWGVDPTPTWDTLSPTVTYLGTGTRFVFTESGWVNAWRVWIPTVSANNKYTATLYNVTDPAHVVETSTTITPNVTGWYEVIVPSTLILAGSEFVIILYAQNDAGKAPHTGPWDYTGQTTLDNDPGIGNFNRNNGATSLRINSTDQNALDRDGELAEITPGVEININDGEWVVRVDTATDMTGWWLFNVTTQSGGLPAIADGVKPIFWEISAPQPTDYVKSDLYWDTNQPTWATATGIFTDEPIDPVTGFQITALRTYVDQPSLAAVEDSTGYGADLEFEIATASPDWDVLATSEAGASGGSGGTVSGTQVISHQVLAVDGTFDEVTIPAGFTSLRLVLRFKSAGVDAPNPRLQMGNGTPDGGATAYQYWSQNYTPAVTTSDAADTDHLPLSRALGPSSNNDPLRWAMAHTDISGHSDATSTTIYSLAHGKGVNERASVLHGTYKSSVVIDKLTVKNAPTDDDWEAGSILDVIGFA